MTTSQRLIAVHFPRVAHNLMHLDSFFARRVYVCAYHAQEDEYFLSYTHLFRQSVAAIGSL